jgi:hypothetical protein
MGGELLDFNINDTVFLSPIGGVDWKTFSVDPIFKKFSQIFPGALF